MGISYQHVANDNRCSCQQVCTCVIASIVFDDATRLHDRAMRPEERKDLSRFDAAARTRVVKQTGLPLLHVYRVMLDYRNWQIKCAAVALNLQDGKHPYEGGIDRCADVLSYNLFFSTIQPYLAHSDVGNGLEFRYDTDDDLEERDATWLLTHRGWFDSPAQ